jgi:hypothetical protein
MVSDIGDLDERVLLLIGAVDRLVDLLVVLDALTEVFSSKLGILAVAMISSLPRKMWGYTNPT